MKTIIKENTHVGDYIAKGWGNGYVVIPKGHRLHGREYESIDVDVHYGLTFSQPVTEKMLQLWPELAPEDIGSWIVGFDTLHWGDDIHKWPKEAVQKEADSLLLQLAAY